MKKNEGQHLIETMAEQNNELLYRAMQTADTVWNRGGQTGDYHEFLARVAIVAMWEPTEKMIIAGAKAMVSQPTQAGGIVIIGQPKDVFKAMMKAALEEQS